MKFAKLLLDWRTENNPDSIFPWRNTKDAYEIIVSEILLRKTTRLQVQRLWDSFVEKFPTPRSLSEADQREIEQAIMPLGISHKRSAGLKMLARELQEQHGGIVPKTRKELLALTGVGPYVANAVLTFAFGEDHPLLDTNVLRVIHRVFSADSELIRPRNDPKLWELVKNAIPKGSGREFNLAILDFASAVCTVKNPRCRECKLVTICDYYRQRGIWKKGRNLRISTK